MSKLFSWSVAINGDDAALIGEACGFSAAVDLGSVGGDGFWWEVITPTKHICGCGYLDEPAECIAEAQRVLNNVIMYHREDLKDV